MKIKNSDGELVEAIKVKYQECDCCKSAWFYCPKCMSKVYTRDIGVQSCKNCGQICEVVVEQ